MITAWRRRFRSLSVQLVGLLSLALLPLGAISLLQTQSMLREAREMNRAALSSRTIEVASAERALIQKAMGAAKGLEPAVRLVEPERCADMMRRFVDATPEIVHAGFVGADGVMACSSSGRVHDFSDEDFFRETIDSETLPIEITRNGPVTGQSVVLVRHVLRAAGGRRLGHVTLSIPHTLTNILIDDGALGNGLRIATVNKTGDIVSATGGLDTAEGFLPRDLDAKSLYDRQGETFGAVSGEGRGQVFSVGTLIPDQLALVGSWPQVSVWDGGLWRGWLSLAFPVLMWVAGIVVAYFGMQRLVIRHVTALRSAMRQYALGDLPGGRLTLDRPPEELLDAERAFNRMILFLAQAEAKKEQDLRDKEVLLREVHHRVKNNLQLIASIMNMQSRAANTPETRRVLAGLQRRVRGLAMLHRTLFASPEVTTIDAADLIRALVEDLPGRARDTGPEIDLDLVSLVLYPDQAVPLSMLVAEALTNAIKYATPPPEGGAARVRISLTCKAGTDEATLVVENTRTADAEGEPADAASGLGATLMAAFASQLEGVTEIEETTNRYRHTFRFTRNEFLSDCGADNA